MQNLIGMSIGPFKINDFVGDDGLTEIYRGVNTADSSEVVITVVQRARPREPRFSTRFRREARAIARLEHPNIASVLDFGQIEGGLYVVQGRVEGTPLATTISQIRAGYNTLEPGDITFIIRQVCSALHYAHSKGVVHQAISSGSILLTRAGQAVVKDFGLALLHSGSEEEPSHSTYAVPPEYLSPERLTAPDTLIPAADVYSLGVVLYELLTGQYPYEFGSDVDMALLNIGDTAPDPRLLNPDIPDTVALVILKALAHSPEDRFRTAMQFAAALERAYSPGVELPSQKPVPPADDQPTESSKELAELPAPLLDEPPSNPGNNPAPRTMKRWSLRQTRPSVIIGGMISVLVTIAAAFLLLHIFGAITIPGLKLARINLDTATPDLPTSQPPMVETVPPEPTASETPAPTQTPAPTVTPLVTIEATPIPPIELADPDVGSSLYRAIDGMVMQYVPAGTFLMGTNDLERSGNAKPQHTVMLSDYWIDRTEVTNAQYRLCVADGTCPLPVDTRFYADEARADHPVVYVRYEHALTYCLWLSTQTGQPVGLPTEAQWEKAATWDPSAELPRRFPWGDEPLTGDRARYMDNAVGGTATVGSYPAGMSAYGVLDLAGNVWEWVADWFAYDAYQREDMPTDPAGPQEGEQRVLRGGGWANEEKFLVSSVRTAAQPTAAGGELGFRCALNTGQPEPESGFYISPVELARALSGIIDEARENEGSDPGVLNGWAIMLNELAQLLQSGQSEEAALLISLNSDLIDDQVAGEQIDPETGRLLDTALNWIGMTLTPAESEDNPPSGPAE